MTKRKAPNYMQGRELQEFMRRLNCFESSDLWEFFEYVRGQKIKFDNWDEDYYVKEKVQKFTENPFLWYMSLGANRASQFYEWIMYEWGGNWKEIFEKNKEELIHAHGITKEMLEAVGIDEEPVGDFIDQLESL